MLVRTSSCPSLFCKSESKQLLRKRVIAEKPPEGNLNLVAKSFYIPKNNGMTPQGEDAHFIQANKLTIGVADGVGGWADKGIDAGEYARKLMENAEVAVSEQPDGKINPKKALEKAFLETEVPGSSTACIITLSGDFLHAVNVGDSGFLVIRKGNIVYKSPKQQSSFNHPYQLGKSKAKDNPSQAEEFKVRVSVGDVVVAATDGLFDNMHDFQIEKIVRDNSDQLESRLAAAALANSLNEGFSSPFALEASNAGFEWNGGKYDDITVVAASVVGA